MIPSKSMVNYVGETSRLFPSIRIDADHSFNTPFPTSTNRYSSSTDSTSPDSYFNTPFQSPHLTQLQGQQTTPISSRTFNEPNTSIYVPFTPAYDSPASSFESGISNHEQVNYDTGSSSFQRNSLTYDRPKYDSRHITETQFQARRHRPIIGRKIYASQPSFFVNDPMHNTFDREVETIHQANRINANKLPSHYELFPSNDRSFEFCSPLKKSTEQSTYILQRTVSPTSSISTIQSQYLPPSSTIHHTLSTSSSLRHSVSPSSTIRHTLSPSSTLQHNVSPSASLFHGLSTSTLSQDTSLLSLQSRSQYSITDLKLPFDPASCNESLHDEIGPSKMCMFCRKNGETPTVYMTHSVKEKIGNKYRVTCPILRSHVCKQCGASGDEAHTITYCPILRSINDGKPLKSTTITLKSTRLKSNGRRRY